MFCVRFVCFVCFFMCFVCLYVFCKFVFLILLFIFGCLSACLPVCLCTKRVQLKYLVPVLYQSTHS